MVSRNIWILLPFFLSYFFFFFSPLSKKQNNKVSENNLNKIKIQTDNQELETFVINEENNSELAIITKSNAKETSIINSSDNITGYGLIPSVYFYMGSSDGDRDETPVHQVKLNAFYISKYEVNQKEYKEIIGKNPSSFKGDRLPVENVSWFDAIEYCNQLSVKEGLQSAYEGEGENITCNFAASGYRLPTEAEWEYAASGGKKFKYSGSDNADNVGWYNANSRGMTCDIGTKAANSNGLYDMSGNVAEWCYDWYGAYTVDNQDEPSIVQVGKLRVVRGGSWGNNDWNLRITARAYYAPVTRNSSIGFRVVRTAINKER